MARSGRLRAARRRQQRGARRARGELLIELLEAHVPQTKLRVGAHATDSIDDRVAVAEEALKREGASDATRRRATRRLLALGQDAVVEGVEWAVLAGALANHAARKSRCRACKPLTVGCGGRLQPTVFLKRCRRADEIFSSRARTLSTVCGTSVQFCGAYKRRQLATRSRRLVANLRATLDVPDVQRSKAT